MRVLPAMSFILFLSFQANAQFRIEGKVIASDQTPLLGVSLLLKDTPQGAISDDNGNFEIANVPSGNYLLIASFVGFTSLEVPVSISGKDPEPVTLILEESTSKLNEVFVVGKSESEVLKESVASISLVDAKPFYSRSLNPVDLLNTVSGVQVKQSGGVGNSAEIAIQGLSGRQVRIFIDGIPMDLLLPVEELGIGPSLAMLPLNMIERIEAYKGAVPVSLGADALGGAMNFVTRKDLSNLLELSTQYSSFNTWQTSLNYRNVRPSGFVVEMNGFYTYSDNSYNIDDVKIVNDSGNPETISTRKFHDVFRSYLLKADAGVVNKPWADQALLSFSYADLYDEIQHNFEMRQPYGQALNLASTFNASFQYEKYSIKDRLDINFYLGYNLINTTFVDTTRNIYNWRGDIVGQKTYGGEITTSQNYLQLSGDNISSRVSLSYHLSPSVKAHFNTVLSSFSRKGKDPVAAEYYGEDFFTNPVTINKNIAGLAVEKDFPGQHLTSSTALKIYQYASEGFGIEDGEANTISQDRLHWGAAQAFKWHFSEHLLGKLSYEYATRLPDRLEALGDFSSAIDANPGLQPETSQNVNLGALIRKKTWSVETSAFFRSVENIIILQPVPPPVLSKYENLLKTRVMGLEAEVRLTPREWLTLRANATYQDLRNRSGKENAGVSSDRYFNVRLPNKPYLFGNGEIQAEKGKIFRQNDVLRGWWSIAYVNKFYRYWENDGNVDGKLSVPTQLVNNVGATYEWRNLALSIESQNLFNAKAYDNFRVQKPGRSWHVKLKLFLTKTK